MSASQVSRIKRKAKHSSTLLARHVASLHSRFNLRRVIIEADKSGHRGREEIATIHEYVCSETRIAEAAPFWNCLGVKEQQKLCRALKHVVVPLNSETPVRLQVDPTKPGAALYISLSGNISRVESHQVEYANNDGVEEEDGDPNNSGDESGSELSRSVRDSTMDESSDRGDADAVGRSSDGVTRPLPPPSAPPPPRTPPLLRGTTLAQVAAASAAGVGAGARLAPGKVAGGVFVPHLMREALVQQRAKALRREWVVARCAPGIRQAAKAAAEAVEAAGAGAEATEKTRGDQYGLEGKNSLAVATGWVDEEEGSGGPTEGGGPEVEGGEYEDEDLLEAQAQKLSPQFLATAAAFFNEDDQGAFSFNEDDDEDDDAESPQRKEANLARVGERTVGCFGEDTGEERALSSLEMQATTAATGAGAAPATPATPTTAAAPLNEEGGGSCGAGKAPGVPGGARGAYEVVVQPGGEYLELPAEACLKVIRTVSVRSGVASVLAPLGLLSLLDDQMNDLTHADQGGGSGGGGGGHEVMAVEQCGCPAGTVLVEQTDEPCKHVMILVQGECRLVARSSHGINQANHEIERVVGEGGRDAFSPPQVLSNIRASHFARLEAVQLAVLGPSAIVGDVPVLLAPRPLTGLAAAQALKNKKNGLSAASSTKTKNVDCSKKSKNPFDGSIEPCSVVCVTPTKYLRVPTPLFRKHLLGRPELLAVFRQHAAEKLSWLAQRVVDDDLRKGAVAAARNLLGVDEEEEEEEEDEEDEEEEEEEEEAGGEVGAEVDGVRNQRSRVKRGDAWGAGGVENEESTSLWLDGMPEQSAFRGWTEVPNYDDDDGDEDGSNCGDDGSVAHSQANGSVASASDSAHSTANSQPGGQAARKKANKLRMMLVRTYDGLDPAAQKQYRPSLWATLATSSSSSEPSTAHTPAPPSSRQHTSHIRPAPTPSVKGAARKSHPSRDLPSSSSSSSSTLVAPGLVDPLMPFPTITRNRGLHSGRLPLIKRSAGYQDALQPSNTDASAFPLSFHHQEQGSGTPLSSSSSFDRRGGGGGGGKERAVAMKKTKTVTTRGHDNNARRGGGGGVGEGGQGGEVEARSRRKERMQGGGGGLAGALRKPVLTQVLDPSLSRRLKTSDLAAIDAAINKGVAALRAQQPYALPAPAP